MASYTMYLDESETHHNGRYYFAIGGLIIKNEDYDNIEQSLNAIKQELWSGDQNATNYVLHEMDVGFAYQRLNSRNLGSIPSYNSIFKNRANVVKLYNRLSKLFHDAPITILGVCLNKNALFDNYGEQHMNDQFTIAIQLMIEHYCQFLSDTRSTGNICYEAMQTAQNIKIQQRMYELKALGTMYYSPITIQNHVHEIEFVQKLDNYAGLQLADFIPNTLARYAASMTPKNREFAGTVRSKLYSGKTGDGKLKYGLKILG